MKREEYCTRLASAINLRILQRNALESSESEEPRLIDPLPVPAPISQCMAKLAEMSWDVESTLAFMVGAAIDDWDRADTADIILSWPGFDT